MSVMIKGSFVTKLLKAAQLLLLCWPATLSYHNESVLVYNMYVFHMYCYRTEAYCKFTNVSQMLLKSKMTQSCSQYVKLINCLM